MSHDALWRRRPENSLSAWRWVFQFLLRWSLPPQREWRARLVGASFVSVAYILSNLTRGKLSLFDLLFLAVPISGFFIVRRLDAVTHGTLPTLMESPTFEQFPVAMTLRSHSRTTGEARGWLSVADGWLVVQGLRTTVSLKPDYVSGLFFEKDATRLRLTDGRELSLRLLQRARETTLPTPLSKRAPFNDTLCQWHRGFRPEGEAVLPLRTLHPETAARRVRCGFAAFLVATLVGLIAATFGTAAWTLAMAAVTTGLPVVFLVRVQRFRAALPNLLQ